jgi:hypothetical protein
VLKTMLMLLGEETSFPAAAQTAPSMAEFFKTANNVTIIAPTTSTVTGTSVRLAASAKASNPISAMKIYVNGVAKASVSGALVDKTISMATGTYNVVFQAWDSKGNVYKNSKQISVQ